MSNVNRLPANWSNASYATASVELNILSSPFLQCMLARRFIFPRRVLLLLPTENNAHATVLATIASQEDNRVVDKAYPIPVTCSSRK